MSSPAVPTSSTSATKPRPARRFRGSRGRSYRFRCAECRKTFTQRCHLRRHEATHQPYSAREFACQLPGCDRRFNQESNLKAHMEVHKRRGCEWKPLFPALRQREELELVTKPAAPAPSPAGAVAAAAAAPAAPSRTRTPKAPAAPTPLRARNPNLLGSIKVAPAGWSAAKALDEEQHDPSSAAADPFGGCFVGLDYFVLPRASSDPGLLRSDTSTIAVPRSCSDQMELVDDVGAPGCTLLFDPSPPQPDDLPGISIPTFSGTAPMELELFSQTLPLELEF